MQFDRDRILLFELRQLALQADELSPVRLAVLLQPVGEDQPRRVVVGPLPESRRSTVMLPRASACSRLR